MAKKKGKVRVITLECTEARKEGKTPVSLHQPKRTSKTHPERMEKKKVQSVDAQPYRPSRDQVVRRPSKTALTAR